MRYRPVAVGLLERLAFWVDRLPWPILDCLFPLVQTRALMAAVHVGVFRALAAGPRTVKELAKERDLEPECLELVLRVLVSSGYVRAQDGGYGLTARGRRTLTGDGPGSFRHYVELNYLQWRFLEHLEETLRTGRGLDFHRSMTDPADWELYQRGMLELARDSAPVLADLLPVPRGARRMLDLAGAHGLLGAAVCRRHPPLRSTVLDLPAALPAARALAEKEGIVALVDHRPADVTEADLDPGQDVVLLANIVHHWAPRTITAVLGRVAAALVPGGTVGLWDLEPPAAHAPAELAGDASALYFRVTSTARLYTVAELADGLRAAGFQGVGARRSLRTPGRVLVHGSAPG